MKTRFDLIALRALAATVIVTVAFAVDAAVTVINSPVDDGIAAVETSTATLLVADANTPPPAGQIRTPEFVAYLKALKAYRDNPVTKYKIPDLVTTSTKPTRGAYDDPLVIDVGDQPAGKRKQLFVVIGKAEANEIPGLVEYPKAKLVAQVSYFDRAGVIQVYEWNVNDWTVEGPLEFKIVRGGVPGSPPPGNQGLVGAAISRTIEVGQTWTVSSSNFGNKKNSTLNAGTPPREILTFVYEGRQSQDIQGNTVVPDGMELVADLKLSQGTTETGHLLFLKGSGASNAFSVSNTKNGAPADRMFLTVGGH